MQRMYVPPGAETVDQTPEKLLELYLEAIVDKAIEIGDVMLWEAARKPTMDDVALAGLLYNHICDAAKAVGIQS